MRLTPGSYQRDSVSLAQKNISNHLSLNYETSEEGYPRSSPILSIRQEKGKEESIRFPEGLERWLSRKKKEREREPEF